MNSHLLKVLGESPPKPISDWEKIEKIKREICDKIPQLIDSATEDWICLVSFQKDDALIFKAVKDIQTELTDLGIQSVFESYFVLDNKWLTVLNVATRDMKKIATIEREKSYKAYIKAMQERY